MRSLSDVALIYLILTLLYTVESLVWVRPGCTAISSFFGRFRNPAHNRKLIGNESGQISTVGPAPFDATMIAEPCPVSLATAGVLGFNAASAIAGDRPFCSELLCNWDEMQRLHRDERAIYVDDRLLCRLGSFKAAKQLEERLRELAFVPEQERLPALQSFTQSQYNVDLVRQRINDWSTTTRSLKFCSSVLAIWIFVVGVALYQGLIPPLKGSIGVVVFVIGLFISWWTTNLCFFVAHRRLYPEATANRWKVLFTSMVSPAVSMRASDQLARNLFGISHPLALASVCCKQEEVAELTAAVYRDLQFPKLPAEPTAELTDEPKAAEIANQWRHMMLDAVLQFAHSQQLDVEQLRATPRPQSSDAVSYCPRCHEEFPTRDATCTSCGSRPTELFNP